MSQLLLHWCIDHQVRLVYASSAATYGKGEAGFDDDQNPAALALLRPLNLYGWSKLAFDFYVARRHASGMRLPPQCAGLKFFNVYGPNEYHKGKMISVVKVKYDEIIAGQRPRLFRSDQPGLADGAQRRDFIWVGDVVDVILWLVATPAVSGLFNVGTGTARTYLDLAHAVCRAGGAMPDVEFIDMPQQLQGSYQSFTEARIDRLRQAGYGGQFTPLEDGITRYVKDYLSQPDPYR
jgi:ADP-L-glycero-D-manno-heptose 6-epimerase